MGEVGAGRHDARVSQSAASRHLFLSSFSVSQSIFLSSNVTGDERVGRVAMSMEGKGPGDGFVWEEEDVLSGCICRGGGGAVGGGEYVEVTGGGEHRV